MGIADRDYARASSPGSRSGPSGPGRFSGSRSVGHLGLVSVNTWLIVINIAVFIVGNVLLGSVTVVQSAGTLRLNGVTDQQWSRRVVDKQLSRVSPDWQGMFYHPIYDPNSVATDPSGRPQISLNTGKPIPLEIGRERFWGRPALDALGHFSTGKGFFEFQVWRLITFQFLHADLAHIVFNMLGLWFVGGLVEEYLGRKRYLAFYLISGIFGALAYLLLNFAGYLVMTFISPGLNHQLPALLFDDVYTPLVGASAGVFGVLMAAAFIAPTAIVDVFLVIPMKLRTAVYVFLGLAVLNLLRGGTNAGGDAAHVGGAFAGAYFIRRTHLLRDFFDLFGDSRRKPRVVAPAPAAVVSEVDRVLDKVRTEGLASLTEHERTVLRNASRP